MAKKTDWTKHCKRFLKIGSTPAEQRDYAQSHLLNYDTFRKRLAAYKKSDTFKRSLASQTISAQLRDGSKKSNAKSVKKTTGAQLTRSARVSDPEFDVNSNVKYLDNGTRTFLPGNRAGVTHGGFVGGRNRPRLYGGELDTSFGVLRQMLVDKYVDISDIGDKRQEELHERYVNNDPIVLRELNSSGKVVERELNESDALKEIIEKAAGPMTEIFKVLLAAEVKQHEMLERERNSPLYSPGEAAEITREIIQERIDKKLSVTDTCNLFLLRGVEPPALLSKELEIELRNAEAEVPTNNGITAEQAIELRRTLTSRSKDMPTWLEERRALNAQIYAEFAGVGEELITNSEEE